MKNYLIEPFNHLQLPLLRFYIAASIDLPILMSSSNSVKMKTTSIGFIRSFLLLLLFTASTGTAVLGLTPPTNAVKISCITANGPPGTFLSSLSEDKSEGNTKNLLIPPIMADGELCTVTRSNRDYAPRVYIPVARSYKSYLEPPNSNSKWYLSSGKYQERTSIECGTTSNNGPTNVKTSNPEWTSGEYLCLLKLPPLETTDEGYFLAKFTLQEYYSTMAQGGTASYKPYASRFLGFSTWGPSK